MTASFDDTVLNAWLDGEFTPERRAEIEAWLQAHPLEATRVRLWAADREALRSRLDGALAEPVPAHLTRLVMHGTSAVQWRHWQAWAAGFLVFVLGAVAGAGLLWRSMPAAPQVAAVVPNAWVMRAAVAHSVYVPEVRHAVEVKAQEEHLSRWLTKRLEVPVKLFDLREQGFELVGGRLLPDAAGPSAQLMYQAIAPLVPSQAGDEPMPKPARVTVYLRKPDASTAAEFRYEQHGALGMFYWVEGNSDHGVATGYALVGELPREQLLALAEAIHKQGASMP
ncbi:MAG: anti-sigma factor [Burkholderiaceae bacterium]